MADREPGCDDVPLMERLPEWNPPVAPLCPIPPNAYLRWLWRAAGGRGLPDTLAVYATRARLSIPEAKSILVGIAKTTRKNQHRARWAEREER